MATSDFSPCGPSPRQHQDHSPPWEPSLILHPLLKASPAVSGLWEGLRAHHADASALLSPLS